MRTLRPRVTTLPRVTVVMLGAGALLGVAGCDLQRNALHDGELLTDTVSAVTISGGSGDIDLRVDRSAARVDIRRTVRYAHSAPGKTTRLDGSTLVLETECGRLCDVSYQVTVPKTVTVKGDNGSGNVTLHGMSDVEIKVGSGDIDIVGATGRVVAETGSGNVHVADIGGDLSVTTGSGDVDGRGLRGDRTVVEVSSGNVTLDLPGTGDVSVVAGSGDIDIRVPDRTSRVTADTGSGDKDILVATVPDAPSSIDLRTSSGNITVSPGV